MPVFKSIYIIRTRKAFLFKRSPCETLCDIMDQKIAVRGRADKESLQRSKIMTAASIIIEQCYLHVINTNAYKDLRN